ncbi:MAG: Zn-ribbon domain-containing OB-fold protein [Alphaproteobacteria bacterium]|nr:Zn-ribbon domain-containing OB-fold protein [Alphaproteobacteria bacterium]
MSAYEKPLPRPTPETQHYWEGAKAGELRLQRCQACRHTYFPPRPFCPKCASREVAVVKASGRGRLYSYVINHRPPPGFEADAPYAIAVVELEEGPRMMSNIVGVEQTPDALALDMALEVTFDAVTDEVTLPKFRPAEG